MNLLITCKMQISAPAGHRRDYSATLGFFCLFFPFFFFFLWLHLGGAHPCNGANKPKRSSQRGTAQPVGTNFPQVSWLVAMTSHKQLVPSQAFVSSGSSLQWLLSHQTCGQSAPRLFLHLVPDLSQKVASRYKRASVFNEAPDRRDSREGR